MASWSRACCRDASSPCRRAVDHEEQDEGERVHADQNRQRVQQAADDVGSQSALPRVREIAYGGNQRYEQQTENQTDRPQHGLVPCLCAAARMGPSRACT